MRNLISYFITLGLFFNEFVNTTLFSDLYVQI